MRVAIGILVTLLVFGGLNALVLTGLTRLHPKRRRWIYAIALFCNAFWLLLPWIFSARTSAPVRFIRALLAPPWFSWFLFLLLYLPFLLIVWLIWLPLRKRRRFAEVGNLPSSVYLAVLAFLAVMGFYAALVPLRVERPVFAFPQLPAGLEGTKIAMVTDLHVGMFTRPWRLERIARTINAERPDVLVVTGDMIDDDPHFVPKLVDGLNGVSPDIPIFAVLGNHEIYGDPVEVIAMLRETRVRLLVNEGTEWRKGDGSIWFAGLSDYAAGQRGQERAALIPDLDAALKGAPAGAFTVLLSHQPKGYEDAIERGLPLTLCGHTHGGQFGIRALGWSLAGVFLPYHMGAYEVRGSRAWVNTGTGYWVVPFRLGMTSEITIVTLGRGDDERQSP